MITRLRAMLGAAAVTLIVAASTLLAPLQVVQQAEATLPMVAGPRHTVSTALTLQSDFEARCATAVWCQGFDSADEVDQFRWTNGCGNDPNDVTRPGMTTWNASDGIIAGSLESLHNADDGPNPPDWWRPFSPLNGASNGRGVDDPADGGTISLQSLSPTSCGSQMANFDDRGYYGHTSFHGDGGFDGTEYWLFSFVKIDSRRATGSQDGGKLFYFTVNDDSNSNQEIVTNSFFDLSSLAPGQNLFRMYRSGSPPLDSDDPGDARQPGTSLGTCQSAGTPDITGCWFMPFDVWFALMYHVVPGTESGNDTLVQVWKAEHGETTWTKVWDQANVDLIYNSNTLNSRGHNAMIASGYQNTLLFTEPFWHRYDQLMMSRSGPFTAPQVWP